MLRWRKLSDSVATHPLELNYHSHAFAEPHWGDIAEKALIDTWEQSKVDLKL